MSVQEVSKEAGVSVATVSRVINHSRSVSPETVIAVRNAMQRIGYIPPPVEKRQRRKFSGQPAGIRHGNIAMLFPDVDNRALRTALSGRFMQGVEEVLRTRAINMFVTPLAEGFAAPPCIRDHQVDAVIVRGCSFARELAPMLQDVPCVWLLDGDIPDFGDQVLEDNTSIARLAVEHFAQRQINHVAMINPQGLHYGYRARCEWFSIYARRLNIECDAIINREQPEISLLRPDIWEPLLLRQVEQLLSLPKMPQGLFIPCPDDYITFVYRALAERGVKVGSDIQLVCCSYDPPRLATLDPGITNIDMLPEAMGRAAVETLLWRLRHPHEPQRRLMVLPQLVQGRSFRTETRKDVIINEP